MNEELVRAWIHDLETTDKPQATGCLHNTVNDGYCCLGRACVVGGLIEVAPGDFQAGDFESAGCMPGYSFAQFGLRSDNGLLPGGELYFEVEHAVGDLKPRCLAELNDRGYTFKEIAAILRRILLKEDVPLPTGLVWVSNP